MSPRSPAVPNGPTAGAGNGPQGGDPMRIAMVSGHASPSASPAVTPVG